MSEVAGEVVFELAEDQFGPKERLLAECRRIAVSAFRYGSGVAALRIVNAVGEIVVLPFHGQQIWDVRFHGRRLTMASIFDEPQASREYTRNYGAFLLHCGATAMGNPAPGDTHPLHGELPNAQLQQAQLIFGTDGAGGYVKAAGRRDERVAFSSHYSFAPVLRLGEADSHLNLDVSIRNRRSKPMELMYLAHVNFRPVDGSRIVDATPDVPGHFRVRRHMPSFAAAEPSYRELMTASAADPALHRELVAGRAVDPELVAGMDCVAGPDGWSHALQVLPDGTADFISHRPRELPRAVRWMTRNGDEDALGLVLPATAEADGREAERKKGNVRTLAGGAEWHCELSFGALDKSDAAAMELEIAAARR